ncbi:hypothetical protein JO972_01920 [Verrucomicrobiaceae bacterium 5K15]|uniref:Uncharacterized protein n=1 Tax=Oceaniferula flava TaxID=2800421 RepID=A0AAE2S9N8_9BACT|nr:hypothetical protein [Oceaniferula flavus]MBK1853703.1 hypothetical protein [Oceaniferula flavus]MBM1135009.1 hypothetical protein [Oceaniferula flavus]
MTKTQNNRPSATIRNDIERLPAETRLAWVRYQSAKQRAEMLTAETTSELLCLKGSEDLTNPDNSGSVIASFVRSENGNELASTLAVMEIIQRSEGFIDAEKRLVPLLDELKASEQAERQHSAKIAAAKAAISEAEEAAKARALEAAADDPEIAKAKKALEKIEA